MTVDILLGKKGCGRYCKVNVDNLFCLIEAYV